MFCSVCGAQNTEQVRFCRACGKPLSNTNNLAQSGAADDPFQTRLAIPVEQSSIKQPPQPPAQPARPAAPPQDPFATMVAMPAANISRSAPPPAASSEPVDPFATQVSPAFDAGQLAKELAKGKKPAQSTPDDMMNTVVGGMSPMKPPASAPAPSHSDPMATVVGMPAIMPAKPPAVAPKPAENEKKGANTSAGNSASTGASNVATSNASQNAPFAQKSMPNNYDPFTTMSNAEKRGSSKGVIVGIVVAVVIVLIIIALMLIKG